MFRRPFARLFIVAIGIMGYLAGGVQLTAQEVIHQDQQQQAQSPEVPFRVGMVPLANGPASLASVGAAGPRDMTWHGGPVQHTQKVFTIFWNPTSKPFPSGYQVTINRFVQDLNGSPYYSIASQYSDTTGHISTALVYGGTWLDTTNALPSAALSYYDLLAEVNRAKAANGWTSDANSYFQIYTPSGIGSSAGGGYCGLHWLTNPAIGQILFPQAGCLGGGPYPNGSTADSAITISSHEIFETLTDPLGNGWFFQDAYGGEIGDLCSWQFGARAADGSNVMLNGHPYVIQQEYSNATSSCVLSYNPPVPPTVTTGSAMRITRTTATLTAMANPNGGSTTAQFQYGLTTSYGGTTPLTALGAGTSPMAISGGLIGLACSSLYHFRATSTNAVGTTHGLDTTFTTPSCPTVTGDRDGDRRTDPTVFRPDTGYWYTLQSASNYTTYLAQQWGVSTDIPVPGDYDGDGKTDVAIFRPSTATWWILQSSTNYTTYVSHQWGEPTDTPVPGDYDGDGKTDVAIFRPSTGTWWILQSSTNTTYVSHQWGEATDTPVPGDYDGDGKTDVAIFRPSTATWWILQSNTNYATYVSHQWGEPTDTPVPGDYDGDGTTDVAIFRPSTGTWWILQSSTNDTTYGSHQWGEATDIPVPGDYDGDGKTDVAIFRPSTATWWILQSSTNDTTYVSRQWGNGTDIPVFKVR